MFGWKYLVAPVLELGAREREVWLPKGKWKRGDDIVDGGRRIKAAAPLDEMPVFERVN